MDLEGRIGTQGQQLQQYAIRGTEDEWAAALPKGKSGSAPPKVVSVKGEAREDKGGKKGHAGGGDKKQKRQKR